MAVMETDIHKTYYSDVTKSDYDRIVTADPTTVVTHPKGRLKIFNKRVIKNGQYSRWLLDMYRNGNLKKEDLYKATEYLNVFHTLKTKNRLPAEYRDIGQISSLAELFKINKAVGGTGKPQEDEKCLLTDMYHINSGSAEVFFENDDWFIVIPKTLTASEFYGDSSEWCTLHPVEFERYSSYGNLYIIIDKKKLNRVADSNRRFQFQFETSQFMNMDDSSVEGDDLDIFLKKNNLLDILEPARIQSIGKKITWEQNQDFNDSNIKSWALRTATSDTEVCRDMFDGMLKAKYDFDDMFNYISDKNGKKILGNLDPVRFEILINKMLDNNSVEMFPDVILAHNSPIISKLLIEEKIESSDPIDISDLTSKQVDMIIGNPIWFLAHCKKNGCNITPALVEKILSDRKS